MGMQVGGGGGYNSDINVTPLVDVVLVLLIIFMVVTPLTQRGYDIEIPRESASAVQDQDAKERQVILGINELGCPATQPLTPAGLPPGCSVKINNEDVTLADLPSKMTEIFKNRKGPERLLFVAAQEKMNYEAVVQIVDLAKSGVGEDLKIGIVTDERLAMGTGAGL